MRRYHHARSNFLQYLKPSSPQSLVLRKKYLHVLRPVLSTEWVLRHGLSAQGKQFPECFPPLTVQALVAALADRTIPLEVTSLVSELLTDEDRRSELRSRLPRLPVLDVYLAASLKRHSALVRLLDTNDKQKTAAAADDNNQPDHTHSINPPPSPPALPSLQHLMTSQFMQTQDTDDDDATVGLSWLLRRSSDDKATAGNALTRLDTLLVEIMTSD